MFSGIVAGLGSIKSIKENDDIVSISVTAPKNFGKNLKKELVYQLMAFV